MEEKIDAKAMRANYLKTAPKSWERDEFRLACFLKLLDRIEDHIESQRWRVVADGELPEEKEEKIKCPNCHGSQKEVSLTDVMDCDVCKDGTVTKEIYDKWKQENSYTTIKSDIPKCSECQKDLPVVDSLTYNEGKSVEVAMKPIKDYHWIVKIRALSAPKAPFFEWVAKTKEPESEKGYYMGLIQQGHSETADDCEEHFLEHVARPNDLHHFEFKGEKEQFK